MSDDAARLRVGLEQLWEARLKTYIDNTPSLDDAMATVYHAQIAAIQQCLAELRAVPPAQEAAPNDEIEQTWLMIQQGWDIESREYLEREAKTNGFKYGLCQAVHHMWKRCVKENPDFLRAAAHEQASRLTPEACQALADETGYSLTSLDGTRYTPVAAQAPPAPPDEPTQSEAVVWRCEGCGEWSNTASGQCGCLNRQSRLTRFIARAAARPSRREPSAWQPIETYEHRDRAEMGDTVLVALEGGLVGEAYFNPNASGGTWWWSGTHDGEYADSSISTPVTHWQPLPLPPEDGQP